MLQLIGNFIEWWTFVIAVGLKIIKRNLRAEVSKYYAVLLASVRTHTHVLFWIRCGQEING